ncbi:MAG: ABC transporter substrate-binding protein [Lachnospiraceae bacterium]|nr:ABC transporter substrate-binding protein [Lachnospiraceae bacterium]
MKHSKFIKAMALVLSMIMIISLAACGGNSGGGTATTAATAGNETAAPADITNVTEPANANTDKSDETLTVMLGAEPTTLTGLTGINDQKACVVMYATTARLFEFDPDTSKAVPSLATGYDVIDETHYRIHLREDAVYTDGTPITAQDVVYCCGIYHEAGLDWAMFLNPEETIAEDDHTLVLAFSQYTPGWEVGLCEQTAGIYSQAAIEAVGGPQASERTQPVSGGRYNVADWVAGEYIMLERNENYWDPDYTGYYKNIKVMWASDAASRTLAVKSGDADVAESLSVSECLTLENDSTATPVIFSTSTVFVLYFNCDKEPFNDPKLREAVTYLIDSAGLNQLVNMGKGEVIQGYIPRQAGEYYKDYYENGVHPYDPEKGKQMLADLGYNDLTIECIVLQANMAPATVIQETLRNVGITMNITPMEPANYVPAARKGEYNLTIGNVNNAFVAHDNFRLVDPRDAYDIIGGPKITDEAMIEIVNRAKSSDHDTAVQGWHDVIDYLFDNWCLVGLYNKVVCAATNPDIEGLKLLKRDYVNITELHPIAK